MLNPDFRDMLSELNAAGAKYLVVGAYALAAHGLPRATGDIDIWVEPTPENARRVVVALAKFGAPLDQISEGELSTPGIVFQIGVPPRRIDVMTAIDGVAFADAWSKRLCARIEGMEIPVLGRIELKANKQASGRAKDLADLAWLESSDE